MFWWAGCSTNVVELQKRGDCKNYMASIGYKDHVMLCVVFTLKMTIECGIKFLEIMLGLIY